MVYGPLLAAMVAALAAVGPAGLGRRPLTCVVVIAIATVAYVCEDTYRDRRSVTYEPGLGIALLALVCGGPIAAVLVWVLPDLIRFARRGRMTRLGLLANVVSYLGAALAGDGVLALVHGHGAQLMAVSFAAGCAMSAASYVLARLLFAGLRDGERLSRLLGTEYLPTIPLEIALALMGGASALLVSPLGAAALLPLAIVVCVPQLWIATVARADSVARLDVDRAIDVYLAALSDELALSPGARRSVRSARALLADRPPSPSKPLAAISCALETDICLRRPPVQPAYRPPLTVQALLVADAWARLTARCTRALNHEEALNEMWISDLSVDAPDALRAAGAIAARQQALTRHSASLPRLHRLPLPRSVRAGRLPALLGRIAA